mgnify:FL=1
MTKTIFIYKIFGVDPISTKNFQQLKHKNPEGLSKRNKIMLENIMIT